MPRKPAPEPNLRSWIQSWLRLLSPIDRADGTAGRLLAGLRLLLTASVLLALLVTIWTAVALLVGGAWLALTESRLGGTTMSLFSGAAATAAGSYYRRRRRQGDRDDSAGRNGGRAQL